MAQRANRRNLNTFLFSLFWWMIQKISPKQGDTLLYWGLRSGAFPSTARFDPELGLDILGHHFNTPIGIGAGFDRKANVIDDLIFMGAGFGEFGPYTLDYENPTTETFFLKKDNAIVIESLGWKNPGILKMIPIFINRRYLPNFIGINLTITAAAEGENIKLGHHMMYDDEFDLMARKVAPYCDYITLDFSHPEVELSSRVSDASTMVPLIKRVKKALTEAAPIQTPKLVVKLPLDMTPLELPLVCQNMLNAAVDAVIVGGPLSLFRTSVHLSKPIKIGMLSGKPIQKYVTETVAKVRQFTKGQIPIIACGGVFSGQDAYNHIAAGASLIQLGTAIRFEGPGVITRVNRELTAILRAKGFKSVQEAIGADFI